MPHKLTNESFIQKCQEMNPHYDYSQTVYTGSHDTITIVCPEHGPFEQLAYIHKRGSKCPKCSRKESLTSFIKKVQKKHKYKYIYTNTTLDHFVIVECPTHGEFRVSQRGHKEGVGCPKCRRNVNGLGMTLIGGCLGRT